MRVENRQNIPQSYGNVHVSALKKPASCSRCKKPAKQILKNAFRSSTVCEDRECRLREETWVGHLPHKPIVAEGSWASQSRKQVDDRSLRVGSVVGAARKTA